ncbi:MAG: porin [Gammaproteobacteria bacterium]|nr:porin [Gammaproteobacteria bacterium]
MNKKLIAVAVAGVVAAPVAYADISAYGRINNRIVIADNDDVNMETSGSRFGFKGSGDLGNGMSAFARYEFSTTTDHAASGAGLGSRLSFVGLSGPFGSISLGQQWSAYFQNLGTHASLNIIKGPGQIGPFRTGNTIQYSNSFGPVSLTLDARADDAGDGGGNGLGGGVTMTPMDNFTIAGAFDSNDDSGTDVMGIAGIMGFGGITVTVAHEQSETGDDSETNNTLLWLGAGVTDQLSLTVGYGTSETEDDMGTSETDQLALIGVLNMGGGLKLWGQFHNEDSGSSDADTIALGVRLDF